MQKDAQNVADNGAEPAVKKTAGKRAAPKKQEPGDASKAATKKPRKPRQTTAKKKAPGEIQTVALIGLGGLGIIYGERMLAHMPKDNLRIIADPERIQRYAQQGVMANGASLDFRFVTPDEEMAPADLALFMVKGTSLDASIEAMRHQIGPDTIILSALNGISSEEFIGARYGSDNLLLCIAQGMDVFRKGSHVTYTSIGKLCFGDKTPGPPSETAGRVAAFFDRVQLPCELLEDMPTKMWSKFMLNVGINQVAAVSEGSYGSVSQPGFALEVMLAAMREVQKLAACEGITLTEEDIRYWVEVMRGLNPDSAPSMRQDMLDHRKTEVELFSGTVIRLAEKHDLAVPVNRMLNRHILAMESEF